MKCNRCSDGIQLHTSKPCVHCERGKRIQYVYDKVNLKTLKARVSVLEYSIREFETLYGEHNDKS